MTAGILDLHGTADYRFILVLEFSWQRIQQSEHHVNVCGVSRPQNCGCHMSVHMSVHVPLPNFAKPTQYIVHTQCGGHGNGRTLQWRLSMIHKSVMDYEHPLP